MKLTQHQYGKARVRVMKITRRGARHSIKELEVAVGLQGDFNASYTRADNRAVIATDSMKNIVNLLAKEKLGAETEEFGIILARHFLKTYPQVHHVGIELGEHCWERIRVRGRAHAHSFAEKSAVRPFARVTGARIKRRLETIVESGIEDLLLLKSTGSGFEKFLRDEFTTLPETSDRIFATRLKATWTYARHPKSFAATNAKILEAMLAVFAENFSPSVQVTLFQMGEAALKAAPEISKIHLVMPNQHCLLINLALFGLENKNELFVPTDAPQGLIEGTVTR